MMHGMMGDGQRWEKELRSKNSMYTDGSMSPLIIKMSLALRPPMMPLLNDAGVIWSGSGADSTTFSYHDVTSKDGVQMAALSSVSSVLPESLVPSTVSTSQVSIVMGKLISFSALCANSSSISVRNCPPLSQEGGCVVPSKIWPEGSSTVRTS